MKNIFFSETDKVKIDNVEEENEGKKLMNECR